MVVLTLCSLFVRPPQHLPDLHSVLVSVYSCAHFVVFLVVFHWLQFTAVAKEDIAVARDNRAVAKENMVPPAVGHAHKLKSQ